MSAYTSVVDLTGGVDICVGGRAGDDPAGEATTGDET